MPVGNLCEMQTRNQLIDPMLEQWGWQVIPHTDALPASGNFAVEEFPTIAGPADYVLYSNGRTMGIVEAKKLTLSPQGVLTQAERYSRGVQDIGQDYGGFHVPFLYSTNGEEVQDVEGTTEDLSGAALATAFRGELTRRDTHDSW